MRAHWARHDHRYVVAVRHLVVIVGPIGAGKSTVAEALGRRLWAAGTTVALADLDDIAFAQRANVDVVKFWEAAGIAHSALVRGWFQAGVDVVVAHGPFFESRSYHALFAAAPAGALRHHILLRTGIEVALDRVGADPDRGPDAVSVDPAFLRSAHERFAELASSLPDVDVEIDTSELTPAEVVDQVLTRLRG